VLGDFMKILELLGVKKFAGMTSREVIDFVKSMDSSKLKVLGRGANAVALTDGKAVYKFWLVDSAYEDFIKYAAANQSNPFLPKLLSPVKTLPAFFVRSAKAPDVVKFVKLELLEPLSGAWGIEDEELQITKGSEQKLEIKNELFGIIERNHQKPFKEVLQKIADEAWEKTAVSKLNPAIVKLAQAIYDVQKMVGVNAHLLDLHSGNFMLRGKQLVIIDPIANRADLRLNNEFEVFNASEDKSTGKTGPMRGDVTKD
jgi:hypothetical protein